VRAEDVHFERVPRFLEEPTMTAGECKAELLARIDFRARCLEERATENPGDPRSVKNAAALRALRARIAELPWDAPQLERLAVLWSLASSSRHIAACTELECELLRGYGADARAGDPQLMGDPDEFLEGMIFELERKLGTRGALI
jgi:hypothetical protein